MDIEYQGKKNTIQSVTHHQAIGFDVDHCLVRYKIKPLTQLCYQAIGFSIVEQFKYPQSILDLTEEEYGFALNYLIIHINEGLILRLAQDLTVLRCYRGFRELNVEAVYGPTRQLPNFNPASMRQDPNYIVCATYFENTIPLLFAKMSDHKCKEQEINQLQPNEYQEIFNQIIAGLKSNYNHQDQHKVYPISQVGRFFKSIQVNPELYIFKQNQFKQNLKNLRSQGKTLFIVTNSHYEFMNLTMTYSYGEDWVELFDFICLKGGKPEFFTNPKRPAFLLDLNNPLMKGEQVNQIIPELKFYIEGNYTLVEDYLQQTHKELGRVIYLGDHIMNDCYFAQQNSNWDGIAIVEELYEQIQQEDNYRIEAAQNIIQYKRYWGNYLSQEINDRSLKSYWYDVACSQLKGVIRTLDCPLTVKLWD